MGFSRKEVEESLMENKYNDVMATYLLLSRKVTEVSYQSTLLLLINISRKTVISGVVQNSLELVLIFYKSFFFCLQSSCRCNCSFLILLLLLCLRVLKSCNAKLTCIGLFELMC